MIESIGFDLDGTLQSDWGFEQAKKKTIIELAALSYKISLNRAFTLFDGMKDYLTTKFGPQVTTSFTLEKLGISRHRLYESLEHVNPMLYLTPDQALCDMLERLADDYMLSIITNSSHDMAIRTLRAMKIDCSLFKTITAADNLKNIKPHVDPFFKMLSETNSPCRCLYVGDRLHVDLISPKRLGMKTILVSNAPPREAGFEHLRDITDLERVIGEIEGR